MKNYEKYAEEIKNYAERNFCRDFIRPNILKINRDEPGCANRECSNCGMLQMIWLLEEYEEPKEPEVDWSKVEVDTPIMVRNAENEEWEKSHFAKYEGGAVYAWNLGGTSWSKHVMKFCKYAKLAETEGAE